MLGRRSLTPVGILLMLSVVIVPVPIRGEVFTLRPPSIRRDGNWQSLPRGKKLLEEPIEINGVHLNLEVSLVDIPLAELISRLQVVGPKIQVAANSTSIMVTEKLPHGFIRRLLFVHTGRGLPILRFELQLPANMAKPADWPAVLPRTSDAVILRTIYFPKRHATCGIFSTMAHPADAVRELAAQLMANGWKAVSGEYTLPAAQGELFLAPQSRAIMLLSVGEDGTVVLYTRPLTRP